MMEIYQSLAGPVAWAILNFLWQGAVVALVLGVVLAALKKHAASIRYRVACIALVIMIACPILTLLTSGAHQTGAANYVLWANNASVESTSMELNPAVADTPNLSSPGSWKLPNIETILPWVFTLWLAGVTLLSIIHWNGWRKVQHLKTKETKPASKEWQTKTNILCQRLGINKTIQLLESTRVSVPTVIGWLSPVVLVPVSAFAGLTPDQLETILAHELAHIHRRDYLVNMLQVVAETLLFFHPAVWWVSRQIRLERENCCDDVAVALSGDRVLYARALVGLEALRSGQPGFVLGANGGSLIHRIHRLAGGQNMTNFRSNQPQLAGVIWAVLLVLSGAAYAWSAVTTGAPLVPISETLDIRSTSTTTDETPPTPLMEPLPVPPMEAPDVPVLVAEAHTDMRVPAAEAPMAVSEKPAKPASAAQPDYPAKSAKPMKVSVKEDGGFYLIAVPDGQLKSPAPLVIELLGEDDETVLVHLKSEESEELKSLELDVPKGYTVMKIQTKDEDLVTPPIDDQLIVITAPDSGGLEYEIKSYSGDEGVYIVMADDEESLLEELKANDGKTLILISDMDKEKALRIVSEHGELKKIIEKTTQKFPRDADNE